ncbi:MAG: tetratricopeptide repeat protein [Chitinophagaceae bacterium]|nr:tetratricopeptide repeat protein [Chitinophagaceae bacterium]MBK9380619.1 tetratricopeptide repeat protein [Chitinophagaceae bacterium]MBL0307027.1 tetratricopeptide repeat protein [Chitinophagaceae bacterium]HQV61629.1 tetratricopeptide repeat protein [Chitinophagaceae bacterium]HQV86807.1 tetratricopeptide repeat protein [Chitinophagaceae bacterium]
MAENKNVQDMDSSEVVIAKAKSFWDKYSKPLMIVSTLIILVIGGWYVYQNFFQKPKEAKAIEAMFRAEEYYRLDSVNLALNGDGQNLGFVKIVDKFGGTKAGKLASFYAGSCYLKLNDYEKAVKYLKKFSSSSDLVQARAYKLLGDAYADWGKNDEALSNYKKAGRHFEKDEANSPEYLFAAAYFADKVMKNQKEAISLYKELKEKYPRSQQAFDADNYLAQLGVYSTEN